MSDLAVTPRAVHGGGSPTVVNLMGVIDDVVADIEEGRGDVAVDEDGNILPDVTVDASGVANADAGARVDERLYAYIDSGTGHPEDEEKKCRTLFYCGQEVKLKGDEIEGSYGSSMMLFIKIDVDGPPNNDNEARKQLLRIREKYINAAEKHNQTVCDNVVGENVNGYTDSGFDLFAPFDEEIEGGALGKKVNFRIQCAAYLDEYTPTGYFAFPRSSLSKTPLRLANSVGIIDSGYRGNLMGAFDCHLPRGESYKIKKGVRLLQICSPDLQPFLVKIVDKLDDTTRGAGGFGSTGL